MSLSIIQCQLNACQVNDNCILMSLNTILLAAPLYIHSVVSACIIILVHT